MAVYNGDETHQGSVSGISGVRAQATSSTPDFQVSIAPASLSVTAGQSGAALVSLTPINAGSLTGPMFVTLACAGFPDQSSCTFTPENVEILPNATGATTSSMSLVTRGRNRRWLSSGGNAITWGGRVAARDAGHGGVGFFSAAEALVEPARSRGPDGVRERSGTTACAPRYNYYNHGPPYNLPTPAGSYTLQITAQSSNGIAADTHTTQFALTVQ